MQWALRGTLCFLTVPMGKRCREKGAEILQEVGDPGEEGNWVLVAVTGICKESTITLHTNIENNSM